MTRVVGGPPGGMVIAGPAAFAGPVRAVAAIATAIVYSGVAGQKNANPNLTATMASGYPLLKCLTNTGVSCSGPDSANAIVVREQANVPLFFAKVFGINSWQISATATAGARGGQVLPLDVMIILDTTASMNSADPSCSISEATRLDCALAGVRTLLNGLWPCAQSLSTCGDAVSGNVPNPVDEVRLMVSPQCVRRAVSTLAPVTAPSGLSGVESLWRAPGSSSAELAGQPG